MHRRSPLLAFLASLIVPGLGNLYNGAPRTAALWFVGTYGLLMALALIGPFRYLGMIGFALHMLVSLVARIAPAWAAAREAGVIGQIELEWFNRWYIYLGAIVAVTAGLLAFVSQNNMNGGFHTYFTVSAANEPTIKVNDTVLSAELYNGLHPPARGDMVVFVPPPSANDKRGRLFIKRVVGLPGEQIEFRQDIAYINGTALKEPYAYILFHDYPSPFANMRSQAVPSGMVFLVGDNRDNSDNSRDWGPVPLTSIKSKVLCVLWGGWPRAGKWI